MSYWKTVIYLNYLLFIYSINFYLGIPWEHQTLMRLFDWKILWRIDLVISWFLSQNPRWISDHIEGNFHVMQVGRISSPWTLSLWIDWVGKLIKQWSRLLSMKLPTFLLFCIPSDSLSMGDCYSLKEMQYWNTILPAIIVVGQSI